MKKLTKIWKEEEGSTTILSISILFFGVLMIVLFMNFAKIFAVVDRAGTAAEQASLAATSVVYEETLIFIQNYSYVCGEYEDEEGEIHEITCQLINDYNAIQSSFSTEREAINQLIENKIPVIGDLKNDLLSRLVHSGTRNKISEVVAKVVEENNGNVSGTTVNYFNDDNRIEVRTSATFDSIESSVIGSLTEDIENIGTGMRIPFITLLGWSNTTITLD